MLVEFGGGNLKVERPYRILSPYRNSLSVVFLVREGPLGGVNSDNMRSLGTVWKSMCGPCPIAKKTCLFFFF